VLLGHPSYQEVMADKPRFIPRPFSAAVQGVFAFVRLGRPLFLLGGFVLYVWAPPWPWRRAGLSTPLCTCLGRL